MVLSGGTYLGFIKPGSFTVSKGCELGTGRSRWQWMRSWPPFQLDTPFRDSLPYGSVG